MPLDPEQFLQLYQRYRYEDQCMFYMSRQREFTHAHTQAFTLSIGLIFLAALAGALEGLPLPWLRLACLLTAAICPVLSVMLTGYTALYAFEQQAKLYQDALYNLQKVRMYFPDARQGRSEAEFTRQLQEYVQKVEQIFEAEQGQWGQLARTMKPPEK